MTETLYSSDLTDAQWEMLEPMLPARSQRGRPPTAHRQVIDAIFYNLRTGCQWRLLPKDFGPWETIYGRFRKWKTAGVWTALNDRLRARARAATGKRSRPTAAILDSQTVRSADHWRASREERHQSFFSTLVPIEWQRGKRGATLRPSARRLSSPAKFVMGRYKGRGEIRRLFASCQPLPELRWSDPDRPEIVSRIVFRELKNGAKWDYLVALVDNR